MKKGARAFARNLDLNSANAWRLYCKSGRRPSDIPTCPNTQYANDGWTSWADWLGTTTIATNQREYRSFNDARGGPTPNQENSQRIFRLVQIGLTQRRVGWIGEIGSERMAAASPTRRDLCLSTERYAKPRTRTAPSTAASTCRAAASAASCVL
jgi:hypothetical protein